jgi:SPP1 family predicted phage head-tail adaptor
MLYRDVIDLLVLEDTRDADGFSILNETERTTIFANKKSIRGNEFYQASLNGITLELMFEIRSYDYDEQRYLEFENKRYEIVRTFDKGETIELSCQAYINSL